MAAEFPGKKRERETGFELLPYPKNLERTIGFGPPRPVVQHLVQHAGATHFTRFLASRHAFLIEDAKHEGSKPTCLYIAEFI